MILLFETFTEKTHEKIALIVRSKKKKKKDDSLMQMNEEEEIHRRRDSRSRSLLNNETAMTRDSNVWQIMTLENRKKTFVKLKMSRSRKRLIVSKTKMLHSININNVDLWETKLFINITVQRSKWQSKYDDFTAS